MLLRSACILVAVCFILGLQPCTPQVLPAPPSPQSRRRRDLPTAEPQPDPPPGGRQVAEPDMSPPTQDTVDSDIIPATPPPATPNTDISSATPPPATPPPDGNILAPASPAPPVAASGDPTSPPSPVEAAPSPPPDSPPPEPSPPPDFPPPSSPLEGSPPPPSSPLEGSPPPVPVSASPPPGLSSLLSQNPPPPELPPSLPFILSPPTTSRLSSPPPADTLFTSPPATAPPPRFASPSSRLSPSPPSPPGSPPLQPPFAFPPPSLPSAEAPQGNSLQRLPPVFALPPANASPALSAETPASSTPPGPPASPPVPDAVVPSGGTPPPTPAVDAEAPTVAEGLQQLQSTPCESTGSGSGPQFTLPVSGDTLQSASGSVCGQLDDVPAVLQEKASSWEINFNGDRDAGLPTGNINTVSCTLGGDPSTTTEFTPPSTNATWQALYQGQTSAVNSTNIALNINGEVINIPVTGFGVSASPPSGAASSSPPFFPIGGQPPPFYPGLSGSGAGRRLRSAAFQEAGAVGVSARPRRLLQDSDEDPGAPDAGSTFDVTLTVTRCGGGGPPAGANVSALLNGYTALNQTVPLSQAGATFSGALDFGSLFPELDFSTASSLSFCDSNKANIQKACSAGTGSSTFANQRVLLSACAAFLTSGATQNIAAAPTQVVTACSTIAVELAIICRSAGGVDCEGTARKTFTVNISALVAASGGDSSELTALGAVFQDVLVGDPGTTSLQHTTCI